MLGKHPTTELYHQPIYKRKVFFLQNFTLYAKHTDRQKHTSYICQVL
jgi:hypothetical protein